MDIYILVRVLHIAATCTSLGGLFYARMVLMPNLALLNEPERSVFLNAMIKRFAYIKWTGVIIVAITGVIQWFHLYPFVKQQALYTVFFIIKMIGAFGLFSITLLLALPDERLGPMRQKRLFWAGLNIACGLTILIGAALMRSAH